MLDRERHLLFSLNIMSDVQQKWGDIAKLPEALQGPEALANLRWLLMELINEGAEDGEEALTERQVGRLIHAGNFRAIQTAIFAAVKRGNTGDEEPEDTGDGEETEKN